MRARARCRRSGGAGPVRRVRRCAWRSDAAPTSTSCRLTRCSPLPKLPAMNKYGELAKNHWARTDPAHYAAIEDPEAFFAALGEQAESQIQELAQRLAGPDRPGEEYLQKVGR